MLRRSIRAKATTTPAPEKVPEPVAAPVPEPAAVPVPEKVVKTVFSRSVMTREDPVVPDGEGSGGTSGTINTKDVNLNNALANVMIHLGVSKDTATTKSKNIVVSEGTSVDLCGAAVTIPDDTKVGTSFVATEAEVIAVDKRIGKYVEYAQTEETGTDGKPIYEYVERDIDATETVNKRLAVLAQKDVEITGLISSTVADLSDQITSVANNVGYGTGEISKGNVAARLGSLEGDVSTAQTDIDTLEDKVAAIESSIGTSGSVSNDIAALESRVGLDITNIKQVDGKDVYTNLTAGTNQLWEDMYLTAFTHEFGEGTDEDDVTTAAGVMGRLAALETDLGIIVKGTGDVTNLQHINDLINLEKEYSAHLTASENIHKTLQNAADEHTEMKEATKANTDKITACTADHTYTGNYIDPSDPTTSDKKYLMF